MKGFRDRKKFTGLAIVDLADMLNEFPRLGQSPVEVLRSSKIVRCRRQLSRLILFCERSIRVNVWEAG